jgi:hypothetical protein
MRIGSPGHRHSPTVPLSRQLMSLVPGWASQLDDRPGEADIVSES